MAGIVQFQPAKSSASGTTIPVTLGSSVHKGNALMAFVYWNSTTQTCSCSDGVNSWSAVGTPLIGAGGLAGYRCQAFWVPNVAAGSTTVTATFSGTNTDKAIAVHEVEGGLATLDAFTYSNVTASGGGAFTTGSVATADAGEYVFVGMLASSSVSAITAPFTIEASGSPFASNATADYVIPTKGTWSCSGTAGASNNLATVIAAFRCTPPGRRRVVSAAVQGAVR